MLAGKQQWRRQSDLHELIFFQSLHDDGENDWQKEKRRLSEEEDTLMNLLYLHETSLHTHSWCSHGDPRNDHLSDAFGCCFLQTEKKKIKEKINTLWSILKCVQSADLRVAQFVAIFICDSDAIQNFPDKQKKRNWTWKAVSPSNTRGMWTHVTVFCCAIFLIHYRSVLFILLLYHFISWSILLHCRGCISVVMEMTVTIKYKVLHNMFMVNTLFLWLHFITNLLYSKQNKKRFNRNN